MSLWDRVAALLTIIPILGAMSVAAAGNLEFWPFSNFSMYSHIQEKKFTYFALYGVLDSSDQQIRLNSKRFLDPFDDRAAIASLSRLFKAHHAPDDLLPVRNGLKAIYRRYSQRRLIIAAPALKALRLYQVEWPLVLDINSENPAATRQLLEEYRP